MVTTSKEHTGTMRIVNKNFTGITEIKLIPVKVESSPSAAKHFVRSLSVYS
jgi:hypothetical protein